MAASACHTSYRTESLIRNHVFPRNTKVDLEEDSARVVRYASELAQAYGAELRLVHPVGSDMLDAGAPFQRFLMDTAIEKLASVQQAAHTHFDTWVRQGEVGEVMREAVVDCAAELSVVRRGHVNKP